MEAYGVAVGCAAPRTYLKLMAIWYADVGVVLRDYVEFELY